MSTVKGNVLLIEDDEISRHFLRYIFEGLEINIDTVTTGKQALTQVKLNPCFYDLLLTDIELPDISGVDVVREIREWEVENSHAGYVPIVGISSAMNKSLSEQCYAVGMQNTFAKPIKQADINQMTALLFKKDVSSKECEALALYNQGYSRKEAAQIMNISENTYAWHLKKIRKKFNISSRKGMVELEEKLKRA